MRPFCGQNNFTSIAFFLLTGDKTAFTKVTHNEVKPMTTATRSRTITLYNIRSFVGSEHSRSMGSRLRTRTAATKLVRKLKKLGHSAFAAPVKVVAA